MADKRTYQDRQNADPDFKEKQRQCMSKRRRLVKETLVAEAGGECIRCGYKRCINALEFHHRDPAEKEIRLTDRKLEVLRLEASKCDLLCANCHREAHAGV